MMTFLRRGRRCVRDPVSVIGIVPAPVNTRGRLRLSGFSSGKMRLSGVDRLVLM
jgi:hypothetical protein